MPSLFLRGRHYLFFPRLFNIQISLPRWSRTKSGYCVVCKMYEKTREPWKIVHKYPYTASAFNNLVCSFWNAGTSSLNNILKSIHFKLKAFLFSNIIFSTFYLFKSTSIYTLHWNIFLVPNMFLVILALSSDNPAWNHVDFLASLINKWLMQKDSLTSVHNEEINISKFTNEGPDTNR